jgi:predicted acetyltransferase
VETHAGIDAAGRASGGPHLSAPDVRFRRSFTAAMEEFRAEGRGSRDDRSVIGRYLRDHPLELADDDEFAQLVAAIRADRLEETPRPSGFVPSTDLWWVDGDEYLGRIAVRHRLTPVLLEIGGHIGYDVRPTARRRGHATEMLRRALVVAHDLGIDPALVTCDVDNVGSRAVIERNGGVLEDERSGKLRYWVPTAGSGPDRET